MSNWTEELSDEHKEQIWHFIVETVKEIREQIAQDIEGTNWSKEVRRPHIIAKYQSEMGYVDRHNQFRQGYLKLAKNWKTHRWQTRIQLELLGVTMVDAFLACRAQMPNGKTWTMRNLFFGNLFTLS